MMPPPGWQQRLDRLLAIYDRAWTQFQAGEQTALAERKIDCARRQLAALLALRA